MYRLLMDGCLIIDGIGYLCIYVFYIFHVQTRITQKHKILLATESTYTHSQICELTRIEWVSLSFRDSHLHENLSFTSPALPMFHLLPPSKKKKKKRKNKSKALFKEKKAPGKSPLY